MHTTKRLINEAKCVCHRYETGLSSTLFHPECLCVCGKTTLLVYYFHKLHFCRSFSCTEYLPVIMFSRYAITPSWAMGREVKMKNRMNYILSGSFNELDRINLSLLLAISVNSFHYPELYIPGVSAYPGPHLHFHQALWAKY